MIRDEVLGLCELTNDLLYHKIPKDKVCFYIEESLKIGKSSALPYKGRDIIDICKESGIEIEFLKESKKMYGVSFRAQVEMSQKQTKIWIYKGSLEDLAKNSKYDGRKPISYQDALRIHLCHEFFHYLEYQQNRFVSGILPKIITLQVFGLKIERSINRCSEIAAHAFARELLQLEELPNIYDYIYLINSGQMKENHFFEMIRSYEKMLEKPGTGEKNADSIRK
ncbi:hypothetical protein [Lacrimispora sp.]|uniref:hypothetical protein n=1 Tax=Lacrimispora sp. TaxID=2719234 RepID=UPI0029E332AA|nr:hypothetical protein [Lacrimispora sp.]